MHLIAYLPHSSPLISTPAFLRYTDESGKRYLQQGWLYYLRGHRGNLGNRDGGQRLAHNLTTREAQLESNGVLTKLFDPENRAYLRLWKPNSKGIRSNHRGPVKTRPSESSNI
jgi:hypothetical protein